MVRNCPRCSYLFEREEGFFLGALVVNIAVTEALIIIFIAVSFGLTLPDPPLTKLAIIGAIGAGVTPLVAYPFTKTIWTAVDIIMRNALGESYRDRGRGARQPGVSDSAPQPESRSNGHS